MQEAYRHEALTYRGQDGFVGSCLAIVAAAVANNAQVLFLIAAAKLAALGEALNGASDDVALVAIDQHGRNPARITTLLDSFQAAAHGRDCVGVNEWALPGRSRAATAEAQFADDVLNSAQLRTWPLSVVCLYDEDTLDESALAAMRRSHPVLRGSDANDAFDPESAAATFGTPLDAAPDDVEWRAVSATDLADTRGYVRERAAEGALFGDRLEDLVFATNEVVSNSMQHGGGDCRLAVWSDGDSVVSEVRDRGVIADPLLGRLAPALDAPRGRGLWLANRLCDLVQIRSSQQGTVVRLHMDHVS